MQSFVSLLLITSLSPTIPSSVHRRLDENRHNDDSSEHDSYSPPRVPRYISTGPTYSPTDKLTKASTYLSTIPPSALPTTLHTDFPMDLSTVSPISSSRINVRPLAPSITPLSSLPIMSNTSIECSSNIDGSFGDTVGDVDEYIIFYRYEMETGADIGNPHDVLIKFESEITNVLIRSANPSCSDPTGAIVNPNTLSRYGIVISGIRHGQTDISNDTGCAIQLNISDACYDVAGQLTLFVIRRTYQIEGRPDIYTTSQLSIKDAMDGGYFTNKIEGITRLSLATGVPTIDSNFNHEISNNVGYMLLFASVGLLVGVCVYSIHLYRNRPVKNRSSRDSVSNEDYVEIRVNLWDTT